MVCLFWVHTISTLLFSFLAHGAHLLFPPSYEPEVSGYDALDSHSHTVTTTDNMEMSRSVVYEDRSLGLHQETNLACVLGHRAARRTQSEMSVTGIFYIFFKSTLYNNPSYSHILIGSHLWSIRGQTHGWRQRSIQNFLNFLNFEFEPITILCEA